MSLARDLVRAFDPVALAGDIGMEPDPWQVDLLRSTSSRVLVNAARQVGKSTTTAVIATHRAVYRPESLVLCVSPSMRQSGELFRKIGQTYRKLGRPVAVEQESATSLTLENGSRVLSLPGTEATVRGYTADLLLIDEASRVEDSLYEAVAPMLAVSGGQLIAMSTPFGLRGWWSRMWHEGGAGWERVEVPASACPRIDPEWLADQRATIGDWFYAQEYECQFRDATDQLFSSELVEAMFATTIEPLRIGAT
ncbi:MAG TPA: terminase family protein [Acidimicrobiales bacterium]|nr:terminase family protein [Acidimicrobiales bacterium]